MSAFLQFLFSGLTIGATYGLAALSYSIIYNATGVINFAQGEFMMLGGLITALLVASGLPIAIALVCAVAAVCVVGMAVEKFAVEPARSDDVVALIILTIGASLLIRGLVQVFVGTQSFVVPSFSGDVPFSFMGATLLPQSVWILGISVAVVGALAWFFNGTVFGKAMLAVSNNRFAAQLIGISVSAVLLAAFAMSALVGATAGAIIAPITFTSYDVGIMLGLKGFVAACLGGLGSGKGAVLGGLILGVVEAMTAGFISSSYKDAMPFVLILAVMFFFPTGIFGRGASERV
jgi:branched-chain amino acid transport system permease protein